MPLNMRLINYLQSNSPGCNKDLSTWAYANDSAISEVMSVCFESGMVSSISFAEVTEFGSLRLLSASSP